MPLPFLPDYSNNNPAAVEARKDFIGPLGQTANGLIGGSLGALALPLAAGGLIPSAAKKKLPLSLRALAYLGLGTGGALAGSALSGSKADDLINPEGLQVDNPVSTIAAGLGGGLAGSLAGWGAGSVASRKIKGKASLAARLGMAGLGGLGGGALASKMTANFTPVNQPKAPVETTKYRQIIDWAKANPGKSAGILGALGLAVAGGGYLVYKKRKKKNY